MASLAIKNLFHDRVRLFVTLSGIIFSVVLVTVQLGLFLGFTKTTSNQVDNAGADLWITSAGTRYFEVGAPIGESKYYQILSTPGVADAQKYAVSIGIPWKKPTDGAIEGAEVIGFDVAKGLGKPWRVVAGDIEDLKLQDTVMVDELYMKKLGIDRIGQVAEIRGFRARVVGFTRGIRAFTTSPVVFCSFKNAQNYIGLKEHEATYILAMAEPGANIDELKARLAERVKDVDVRTAAEFARMTQNYWMFGTGAGVSLLLAAGLGLVVGIAVVAQTIYAATIDHLREFGTLKAMGASNGYIYRVIIKQAVLSGIMGYAVGIAVGYGLSRLSAEAPVMIHLPPWLAVALFALTIGMCISASLVSIHKVTYIDPAMVFKG